MPIEPLRSCAARIRIFPSNSAAAGLRLDDVVAYEFELPERFEPWPGARASNGHSSCSTLGELCQSVLDTGNATHGTVVEIDPRGRDSWYVDLVTVEAQGDRYIFPAPVHRRDRPTDGRHYRMLDLDEYADAMRDSIVSLGRRQRWIAALAALPGSPLACRALAASGLVRLSAPSYPSSLRAARPVRRSCARARLTGRSRRSSRIPRASAPPARHVGTHRVAHDARRPSLYAHHVPKHHRWLQPRENRRDTLGPGQTTRLHTLMVPHPSTLYLDWPRTALLQLPPVTRAGLTVRWAKIFLLSGNRKTASRGPDWCQPGRPDHLPPYRAGVAQR